jgi:pimeloyl-ACP methyl ester carboxylesterase
MPTRSPTFLPRWASAKFDLLANSFGTRVAQCFAARHLVVLDGCGHLPEVEQPQRVNALVREFLTKGRSPGS